MISQLVKGQKRNTATIFVIIFLLFQKECPHLQHQLVKYILWFLVIHKYDDLKMIIIFHGLGSFPDKDI